MHACIETQQNCIGMVDEAACSEHKTCMMPAQLQCGPKQHAQRLLNRPFRSFQLVIEVGMVAQRL